MWKVLKFIFGLIGFLVVALAAAVGIACIINKVPF